MQFVSWTKCPVNARIGTPNYSLDGTYYQVLLMITWHKVKHILIRFFDKANSTIHSDIRKVFFINTLWNTEPEWVRTGTGDYERSEPETPVVLQCPNWPCDSDNAMSMVSTIMWGNVRWCLAFDKQNKFVFISLWSIVSWSKKSFSVNDNEDNFSNRTQILFPKKFSCFHKSFFLLNSDKLITLIVLWDKLKLLIVNFLVLYHLPFLN